MSEPPPEQTSDDMDVGWGERPPEEDDDQRLRNEVPPHHNDRD